MLKRWRLWALRRSLTSLEEEHPSANGDDEWDLTLAAETILLPSFTVSLQHHLDCTQLFVCRYRHCGYIALLDLVLLFCVYRCCVSFFCFVFCFIDQSAATRQIPAHLFYLWKWNGFNYSVESLNIEQTSEGTLQSSFKASGFKRENGARGFRATWTGSPDVWLWTKRLWSILFLVIQNINAQQNNERSVSINLQRGLSLLWSNKSVKNL